MPDTKPAAGSEPQPASEPAAQPAALYYTGDATGEPYIHGIPARDLTEHDLDRLAFVESQREGKKLNRTHIYDRLVETDLYRKSRPAPTEKEK